MKDDRKQFVTALGSVITALVTTGFTLLEAGSADATNAKPIFPLVQSAAKDLDTIARDEKELSFACNAVTVEPRKERGIRVQKEKCGTVTYGPLPKDAVLRDKYMAAVKDTWTDTFPVPACRSAKVVLKKWNAVQKINVGGRTLSWPAVEEVHLEAVVSDPEYVRVVKLPPGGEIAFHTSCGANVEAGDITTDPIWAAVAELGTQAKAIKEAQEAEKE